MPGAFASLASLFYRSVKKGKRLAIARHSVRRARLGGYAGPGTAARARRGVWHLAGFRYRTFSGQDIGRAAKPERRPIGRPTWLAAVGAGITDRRRQFE